MASARPPLWNIPYKQNPYFTDREDTLHQPHRALRDAIALSQPQAITGLGGIGKTQMALDYAYCYGSKYAAVLWVRADTLDGLIASFTRLAHVLNLPESAVQWRKAHRRPTTFLPLEFEPRQLPFNSRKQGSGSNNRRAKSGTPSTAFLSKETYSLVLSMAIKSP